MTDQVLEADQGPPPAFPIALRANEGILTERLTNYVRAFSPVVQDLDELTADLGRELTYELNPRFLIDFSEIHDIINPLSTGDIAEDAARAWTAGLIEDAIAFPLPLALPAGTLLELANNIARAGGQMSAVPEALRHVRLDETAGLMTQPRLEEVFAQLPTRERLSESISELVKDSGAATGYARLAEYIRGKSLSLLHTEEELTKSPWKQHVFTAIFEYLSKHRVNRGDDNSIDALNLALAYSSNDDWRSHRRVSYLIGRSPWVRRASDANPWTLDPAVKNLDQKERGVVRSPAYLFLRTRFGTGTLEERARQYVRLGKLHRNLREVIDLMAVATRTSSVSSSSRRAKVIRLDQHDDIQGALIDAVDRLSSARHSRDLTFLYAGWETYRRLLPDTAAVSRAKFFVRKSAIDGRSTKTALEEIVKAAEQAREDAVRRAEGRADSISVRLTERASVEVEFGDESSALFAAGVEAPVVHLSVINNDYYSLMWHSTLDIHSMLDWIDTYASQVNRLTAVHYHSLYYERPINGHCVTIRREPKATVEMRFQEESPSRMVHFGEVPFSRLGRQIILSASNATETEAVRLYTPYGDFWLNFVYSASGALRTGFVSHVPAPAFLAQLVAFTSHVTIPASRLFKFFDKRLKSLSRTNGDTDPPLAGRKGDV